MGGPAPETRRARRRMVVSQLANRGIRDCRVLAAMAWLPREWILPPHLARDAYEDPPLPITEQLAPVGLLGIPVGDLSGQELVILQRGPGGNLTERHAGGVRFVPLISRLAFTEEPWT